MRIIGWCTVCHRVKQVQVTRWVPGGVQSGTCAECAEKERTR